MIKVIHTAPYSDNSEEILTFQNHDEVEQYLQEELRNFKDVAHQQIDEDFYNCNYDAYAETPEEAHKIFEERYHIDYVDNKAYISFPGYHYSEGFCDIYEIIDPAE